MDGQRTSLGHCDDAVTEGKNVSDVQDEVFQDGGVWVFRTVCCEWFVLSSPGRVWPGRMDDHEEVLEAHA